ncbi:polymer-forming cytoskeletal protein [Paenibacillus alkaliterrae]|uniref:bactofilin family protein n=1 Tax=Paenibacillus alkaliterrae TaxID=320909 RepID=UPI001F1F056D|nr:polymer-forming cytoskeletal protein [Paenibacillus alkaliterrae]MCF2939372.1 polymer-forming cytoskeletal protein [Paenibacillus alkaliterrae]
MFKSKGAKINPDSTDTLVGEGSTFEGKIKSEAGIRVDGHIMGDMESSGSITIGENGIASSNVAARDLVLAGKLTGNVVVMGTLTIRASGTLIGNISAGRLIIEAGGVFHGTSLMEGMDAPVPAEQEPAASLAVSVS